MIKSSARILLALGCLIGAVGGLSVFELRTPFDRRLERLTGQQPKEVVNVQLANPLNYLPSWATAGFTGTWFRCDDGTRGGKWQRGSSVESSSLRR